MPNQKIDDMTLAGAVVASMQLETDITGITANKITIPQLVTYFDANLTFAAVSHTHVLADITDLTDTDDLPEGASNKYATTASVNTAGAVMETDFNAQTILLATADNTPLPITITASTLVGRKSTGDAGILTPAEVRTLLTLVVGTNIQAFDANLEDIAALDIVADNEVMIGTGVGIYAFEGGVTLRASIGVDAAGTDNSTDVTLAGIPNYITISGQVITRGLIDLATDVTGDLPVADGGTGSSTPAGARTNLDVDQAGTDNSTDVTLAGAPDYITISGQVITRGLVDLTADITGDLPFSNIVQVATDTFLGRITAATGDIEVLTNAQAKTALDLSGNNTGDQTITLTGDITGSGTGSFGTTIANGAVDIVMLSATGTPDATTFLRGDNTWSVPSGAGDVVKVGTPVNNELGVWTGNGTIEGDTNLQWDGSTLAITGALTVSGNFTVNGTVTTVNTTTLSVEDPLIQLANSNNTTDVVDIGIVGLYDTSGSLDLYAGLFRDATDGKWRLFVNSQEDLATTAVVNTGFAGYTVATLVANLEGNVTGNVTGQVSDLSNHDTDDLAEGATNKYATTGNIDSAGAVMESDFNANTILSANADNTPLPLTMGASTIFARLAAGNAVAATTTEIRTLINVADGSTANAWVLTLYTDPADFTAGSTTILTMPAASSGNNKANVLVFFNGLAQHSGQWGISGTTITFTSAIPVGVTDIEIRVFTGS